MIYFHRGYVISLNVMITTFFLIVCVEYIAGLSVLFIIYTALISVVTW